jgi:hypothetical protein
MNRQIQIVQIEINAVAIGQKMENLCSEVFSFTKKAQYYTIE